MSQELEIEWNLSDIGLLIARLKTTFREIFYVSLIIKTKKENMI